MANEEFEKCVQNADLNTQINSDQGLKEPNNLKIRDNNITKLVESIKLDHENRIKNRRIYQQIITLLLLAIVFVFFIGLITIIVLSAANLIQNLELIITLVTSVSASFVASVISLLLVVVKYIFPVNQDENNLSTITKIHSDDIGALCRSNKQEDITDI